MTGDRPRTAGTDPRARRLVRRPAAAFLFALFVVANPAYFCPINCLLHHDGDHAGRHDRAAAMSDACYPGPMVTPQQAPAGRDLSPAVPAVAVDLPATGRDVEPGASRSVTVALYTPSAPPPPPPRA